MQQWQSRAGLGHAPRTILEEFSRIHAADIVLPLAGAKKRESHIRCVVRPDREQAILLEHPGLTLPERLRSLGPLSSLKKTWLSYSRYDNTFLLNIKVQGPHSVLINRVLHLPEQAAGAFHFRTSTGFSKKKQSGRNA